MTTAMEQVLNARCNRADLSKHKWPASQNTCASWVKYYLLGQNE